MGALERKPVTAPLPIPDDSRARREEQVVTGERRLWLLKQRLAVPLPGGGRLAVVRKWPLSGLSRAAIVLLHGFAQNRYTWHLSQRSLSAYLVERGYDVFNVELRGHAQSRGLGSRLPARFEEHVDEDLPAVARSLEALGHRQFFLFGHSLGGAVAYAAAPRLGGRVRGVATSAGVFHWGGGAAVLRPLTRFLHAAHRLHHLLGVKQGLPIRMDWVGRLVARSLEAVEEGRLRLPAHGWARGGVELEVAREWLSRAFDRSSGSVLALMGLWARTGAFCDTAGRVDYASAWAQWRGPLLVMAGDRDELADAEHDVRPAFACSRSPDRTYRAFGARDDGAAFGHIDLLIGRAAPERVWPFLGDWFDARAGRGGR